MDFDDFDLDAADLAFALGISEEMVEEELERLRLQRELEQADDKPEDDELP